MDAPALAAMLICHWPPAGRLLKEIVTPEFATSVLPPGT